MRRLRLFANAGAAALLTAVLAATATPALALGTSESHADRSVTAANAAPTDSGIEVSTDGIHFAPNSSAPLFDPSTRIVPGDAQTASLYIRNDSTHAAAISLHATKISAHTIELARLLELQASTGGSASGAAVRLSDGQCLPLISEVSLPAGTTTHITLNLAMSAGAHGSQGQRQHVDFDVLVSARDRTEPRMPGAGCATGVTVPGSRDGSARAGSSEAGSAGDGSASSGLADTGSDLFVPLAGASMLVGAGAALWFAGRKRRRDEREPQP